MAAAQVRLLSVGIDLRVSAANSHLLAAKMVESGEVDIGLVQMRDAVECLASSSGNLRLLGTFLEAASTPTDSWLLACSRATIAKFGPSMLHSFLTVMAGLADEFEKGQLGETVLVEGLQFVREAGSINRRSLQDALDSLKLNNGVAVLDSWLVDRVAKWT